MTSPSSACGRQAKTIYVDINAPAGGDGSVNNPFKHINDAAQVALPGDEVLVAPGIYREYVDPKNAGTEDARITYRSAEPLGAEITGAEIIKDWKPFKGNVWVCRVDNKLFGDYNPYTTFVGGDWYFAPPTKHTGAVYLNGRQLYEADTLEDCIKGEVFKPSWEPESISGIQSRMADARSYMPTSRDWIPMRSRSTSMSAGVVSSLRRPE